MVASETELAMNVVHHTETRLRRDALERIIPLTFQAIESTLKVNYSDFHMGKPQMLCKALGIAKPLRNGVADATKNGCNPKEK